MFQLPEQRRIDELNGEAKAIRARIVEARKTTQAKDELLDIVELHVVRTERYHLHTLQQMRAAFWAAILASVAGFVVFAAGIFVFYGWITRGGADQNLAAFLGTLPGLLTQVISGLFFWMYRRASSQFDHYHDQLVDLNEMLMAIEITARVEPPERTSSLYEEIVRALIHRSGSSLWGREEMTAVDVKSLPRPPSQAPRA